MVFSASQEKKSFYVFVLLVFIIFPLFCMDSLPSVLSGIGTIFFGVLGIFRYIYLSHSQYNKLPKILTLPSRILFGLNQQQEKEIQLIIGRFVHKDCLFFISFGFSFVIWCLYCSLYPAEPSLVYSFWEDKNKILPLVTKPDLVNFYAILQYISYSFMTALIILVGITYSQNNLFLKKVKIIFLPIITLLGVYIIFLLPTSFATFQIDFSHIKGMGWGGFEIFSLLSFDQAEQLNTGFLKRYIETGFIGAFGLYLVFSPFLVTLLRQAIYDKDRLLPLLTVWFLILLAILDIFWLLHPLINGIQVLLLAFIGCAWGHYHPFNRIP